MKNLPNLRKTGAKFQDSYRKVIEPEERRSANHLMFFAFRNLWRPMPRQFLSFFARLDSFPPFLIRVLFSSPAGSATSDTRGCRDWWGRWDLNPRPRGLPGCRGPPKPRSVDQVSSPPDKLKRCLAHDPSWPMRGRHANKKSPKNPEMIVRRSQPLYVTKISVSILLCDGSK